MIRVILAAPFAVMLVLFLLSRFVKSDIESRLATHHPTFLKSLVLDDTQTVPLIEKILEGDAAGLSFNREGKMVRYAMIFHDHGLLSTLEDAELMRLVRWFQGLWGYFKWSVIPAIVTLFLLVIELSID